MKRMIAAMLLSWLVPFGFSQTLFDNFSTSGSLVGTTPDVGIGNWTQIGATSLPAISVSGGSANLAAASGQSAQLNFSATNLSSGTIYAGITFTVASGSISGTSNNVSTFFGFRSTTGYEVGVGIFRPSGTAQSAGALSTTTSQFQVGFGDGTSLVNGGTRWNTVSNTQTSYRLVIGWDLTNNSAQLWLNPTSASSPSITISSGLTGTAQGIYFRQGAATSGQISLSNLQVSTDFATASAVPEPSTYAAGAGVLALAAASWRRRSKRRALTLPNP
jgi:hypothetical protein